MALRLEEQAIRLEIPIGENSVQTVVEGTVAVPGERPRIDRALRLLAVPRVTECQAQDGRVSLEGVVDLRLLYATAGLVSGGSAGDGRQREDDEFEDEANGERGDEAETPLESVYTAAWPAALPISVLVDVPECEEGVQVRPEVRVETTHFEIRSDHRTLDVDLGLECAVRVTAVRTVQVAHRAVGAPHVECEYKAIRVQNLLAEPELTGTAEGQLRLTDRAAIGRVLLLEATPAGVKAEARDGAIVVTGALDVKMLYVAEDPDLGVRNETWPQSAPFELRGEAPGVRAGTRVKARLTVGEVIHRMVSDGEGQALRVTAAVRAEVQAVEAREVSALVDLFAAEGDEIAVRKESLRLFETLGERTEQVETAGTIEIGEENPTIDRLLLGEARVTPVDVHVLGDRVAIEGSVSLTAAYVGRNGARRGVHVASWTGVLPFDCEVPIEGAAPGMERWVHCEVAGLDLDLINRETIEARLQVAVTARVGRSVEIEAVAEAVTVPPALAEPPSFTFLVLQPKDTLWKVARQYRTDIAAIVAANPWMSEGESEVLPVGRKLCIPRGGAGGTPEREVQGRAAR